ncbi:transcription elongation factor GreA [Candidatus Wolfebacteria bacterium]|nr:transcription elongation factor GreA [Candidatus Wolfebacteria bacterium]
MTNFYLTKERVEELKVELNRLKKEGRSEIAAKLKRAKEYGDLSENAEYSEAKDEQARVETRIFELENILRNVSIIKKTSGRDNVSIGATIEVKKGSRVIKYTIVGSNEAKPEANLISNESPLGKAFLGKKKGDSVEVQTPSGKVEYKIMKIE